MSAVDELFTQLKKSGRKAFMPFITAGDPDLSFTAELIQELARRGASMCEIGIPYSDPIADGPVIQASYTRSLQNKVQLGQILEMLREVSGKVDIPLVTMVSYAIVYRYGAEAFIAEAKAAGVAGAIVPDLPVDESTAMADFCRRDDFSLIQLVTPTTPRERALRIAAQSSGFLYYVSVTGITGERTELPPELVENVRWLRSQTELPICIGFGVSQVEHVKVLSPIADGLIVGSAIVRRVAEPNVGERSEVIADIGDFVAELMAAMEAA